MLNPTHLNHLTATKKLYNADINKLKNKGMCRYSVLIFYLKKLNDIKTRVTHLVAFKFHKKQKILACVRRLTSINPEPRSHPYKNIVYILIPFKIVLVI